MDWVNGVGIYCAPRGGGFPPVGNCDMIIFNSILWEKNKIFISIIEIYRKVLKTLKE